MGKHPEDPRTPDELSYEVGYRKPPKSSQFSKGQSGNPSGRPKATPGVRDTLDRLLGRELTVSTAEGPKSVPTVELLLQATIKKGLGGSVPAARAVFELAERHKVGIAPEVREPDEADTMILIEVLRDFGGRFR